jgi:hypothetical protein
MPSFKPKTTKKINVNQRDTITLDSKHNEFLEKFQRAEDDDIPKLKAKKKELQQILRTQALTLDKRLEIKDKIIEIKDQILSLKKEKKDYFLNNGQHIFDYFENKKQISDGNTKKTLLEDFFNVKCSSTDKNKQMEKNTNSYVQEYLQNLDDTFIDINNFITEADICQSCHKGELIPVDHEGILVCNSCSRHVSYLIENEKPSYKEPPKEVCFYAYKRINHFREILAQFQAKETTQIPPEVIENIKLQIKKERIELKDLTNKKAKEVLKKLSYNKYYEHIPFIKDKLGIKPPIMSQELEETLCNLFMEIQGPYAKWCPDNRVNFLNYYYTVYKLCELLDQQEFLPFFPMLKDREKRIEQDQIWKQICKELDWEFIPTV